MKKAYTITPDEYHELRQEIHKIDYRYGYECGSGHSQRRLSPSTPERTRKRYEKLTAECEAMPKPENHLFFRNPDLYNLWLNRYTNEPITARELYNIVAGIAESIGDAEDRAKSSAAWSNWDGR